MRQHLGILLVLIFLALFAALAWALVDRSVPGYRSTPAACHCAQDDAADDGPDNDAPELL